MQANFTGRRTSVMMQTTTTERKRQPGIYKLVKLVYYFNVFRRSPLTVNVGGFFVVQFTMVGWFIPSFP